MSNDDPFADDGGQSDPGSHPSQQGFSSIDDFLSGGTPSAKFTNIGDVHQGIITHFEVSQQRDIKTGAPKTWPDGKPCEQLLVTIQTNERSTEIDDDSGERRLYINRPGGMYTALTTAIKKSGAKFAVGGTLAFKYVGNGVPTQKGYNAPKQYAAKYAPPGATMQQASAAPAQATRPAPSLKPDPVAAARSAAQAAIKLAYPTMDSTAILVPWKAVIASVSADLNKTSQQFSAMDWQRVQQTIEAENAAPLPGDSGRGPSSAPIDDGIPFRSYQPERWI